MPKFMLLSLMLSIAAVGNAGARAESPPAAAAPTAIGHATLALSQRLDSEVVKTGDRFALTVVEDLLVDGAVLVPRGAVAQGTVLFSRRKGPGRSGALDLRVDHIEAPAGRLRVRASLSQRSRYIAAEAAIVHGYLAWGSQPPRGDSIVLEPGATIVVEVLPPAAIAAAPAQAAGDAK